MSKPPVFVIAAVQLLLVSLAGAGLHFYGEPVTALSVVLGGALCALPNTYFGLRAFRGGRGERGARAARQVLENFYRGETGKFVLTLAGFAAVFAAVRPLNPAALFISYGLCVIVQWLLVARLVR
ncbi:ATP synthase subunit I [Microbulbifer sp. SAOS-129_SWC]|uniref:ATP synthase subunit I n=1 Tax=Microbulbifer sp. SAOS-129_SWC TaxID=3145235 RepID=UPI0032162FFB